VAPFQWFVVAVCAWLHREQTDLIAFLREENRVLKSRLSGQRLRFEDDERCRLGELGHRLGRRLLAQVTTHPARGRPSAQRPMTWRTFRQVHWPALVAADFFTAEVWTARGLVTYYVAFLLDVQSRRIQMIGCTPYPDEAFVIQCLR